MMTLKYIIITADVTPSVLNKLLISLRDWEFGQEPTWDNCTILRSLQDISSDLDSRNVDEPLTSEIPASEFRGKSVQEVEDMILAQNWDRPSPVNPFLLLDQQGIEEETIIFADRALGDAEDSDSDDADLFKDHFNKVRVPWMEAHGMWCNLAVQYIGFESFTEEHTAPEDGWCTYKRIGVPDAEQSSEDLTKKRDAVLRDWAKRKSVKHVIVTAAMDVKLMNKLLLSLRDWEFGEESTWDDSAIIYTMKDLLTGTYNVDHPPIQSVRTDSSEFREKSVQDVENMVLGGEGEEPYLNLFLILDQQGIEEETIIVADRAASREDEDEFRLLKRYNKVRVPWIQAHIMWTNLEIANMDFEDFCDDFWDDDEEGAKEWFTYQNVNDDEYYRQFIERRNTVLRELAKLDLA